MKLLARASELLNGLQRSHGTTAAGDESDNAPVIVQSAPAGPESPTDSTWQGRPGSLADLFIGRDAELDALARAFRKDRAVVITGPSGAGKSRLAAEFTHRSGAPGFWTAAGATLEETLSALAPALYLPIDGRTDREIAGDVRRLLEAFPGDTLWVVDNLADADHAGPLLEACGQIRPLVTLRDDAGGQVPDGYGVIELGLLEPESALKLLGARGTDVSGDSSAAELVEYVGRSPVAIELIGGMLSGSTSPGALLSKLRKTAVGAPENADAHAGDGHHGHVLATAALAFKSLPAAVRRQVAPLAYAGDAPISQGMFASLLSLEGDDLLDVFRACGRRSLLAWHGDSVRIHPIVTAAIPMAEQAGGVGGTFKRAVAGKKGAGSLDVALRRMKTRLARANRHPNADLRRDVPHYESILGWTRGRAELDAMRTDFVAELAVAFHALGRAGRAVTLTEESLADREAAFGIDHPSTIAARNNLASAYQAAGRIDEAVAVHEHTLAEAERTLGPEHPTTFASRKNLAGAHRAVGRINQAVPLYEKAVEAREKSLGPEHPDTLASRNMLAAAYQASGQVHKAVGLYEKTLRLRELVLGPDHPDTVATRSNLATAYQAAGRLGDALELYEDAFEARARLFGPEDRRTLTVKNNMATAYHSDGRLTQAMEMYRDTLETRTRTLGEEHIGTLTSRNNLASANRAIGNLRDALMMYEQNVVDRTRILGPEHPKTLTSMNNAAAVRSEVGNVEEAIPAFEQILEVADRVLGTSHPITVTCTANLASAYRAVGRIEDARRIEGEPEGDPDR